MKRNWSSRFSIKFPVMLLVVLLIAAACGTSTESGPTATPQPTPTPIDIAAIVQQALAGQTGGQPAGVTADEVAKAMREALAAQTGITTQDVATEIAKALAAQPGVTTDDVASAIANALSAQPGVTSDDVAKAIQTALASRPGISEAEVAAAIARALAEQITTPVAEPTATAVPDRSQPIFGGVPSIQLYAIPFGDFLWKGSAQTTIWSAPVYNKIIEFNPETDDKTDQRGDVAKEWSVAADGLTYTFKLHENVKFHDGMPLTAEDVVYTWKVATDCESVAVLKDICPLTSGTLKLFSTYYKSSRVVDSHTVELTSLFTAPALVINMSQTAMRILPKHLVEAGKFPAAATPENVIGSGPFKMTEFSRDIGTQYEKNTDYFKEEYPRWDGMKYFVLRDKGTVIAAYKTEQILMSATVQNNLSFLDGVQLAREMGDRANFHTSGPQAGMGLLVNAKVPEFDNDEVRKAFMLILHRQPIIETLSGGFYPIGFPIAPDVYWFSRSTEEVLKIPGFRELNGEKHPDDIAEAKRLFANHGMGPGFKVAITCRTILEYCAASTIIADQFRRFLDWDITVDAGDPTVNIGRFNDGDYQLGFMANSCGFPDPDSCLTSAYALPTSGMRRRAQFTSDKILELSDLQTKELDREKRLALVREAEEVLLNGQDAFPYAYFLMSAVVINTKIQNYHAPAASLFSESQEHLWCDPAC